jgi:hypothetical protein
MMPVFGTARQPTHLQPQDETDAVFVRYLLRIAWDVELLGHDTTERLEGLTTVLGGEGCPELGRCYLRGRHCWRRGACPEPRSAQCLYSLPCAMIGVIPCGELTQRR